MRKIRPKRSNLITQELYQFGSRVYFVDRFDICSNGTSVSVYDMLDASDMMIYYMNEIDDISYLILQTYEMSLNFEHGVYLMLLDEYIN